MNIDYLRLSVTDCCNLSCIYCRPAERKGHCAPKGFLSFKEIERLTRLLAAKGIRNIRLTGGEPLLRKDIADLVRIISNIESIEDISLTTNGILFAAKAGELKQAGLRRVNISLDTLRPARYNSMTGENALPQVLEAVKEALRLNLLPVKINVVLLRGINDQEIINFAEMSLEQSLAVRFIEYAPTSMSAQHRFQFLPNDIVKQQIESSFGSLEQTSTVRGSGPAYYYKVKGALGSIGFISSRTRPFCSSCNRLRLSSDGRLFACLYSRLNLDLRQLLREHASDAEIIDALGEIFSKKSSVDRTSATQYDFDMSAIGG